MTEERYRGYKGRLKCGWESPEVCSGSGFLPTWRFESTIEMDKHRLEEIYRHDDSLHEGIPEKKKKKTRCAGN